MDILIRVSRECAYEVGVTLNKYKMKFWCDITECENDIRYRIEGTNTVFMSGEHLIFCNKDCELISLDNIKSIMVVC